MDRHKLSVEKRTITGKKVKKLRQQGVLPGNIYGKDLPSFDVQVKKEAFYTVFKQAGQTGLVDLVIDEQIRPVLIHVVQRDYLTHQPVHADFYQVNLKEKVRTMVPVTIIGEAKAVTDKLGMLIQTLSEVEAEALPENLPERIELDVTPLEGVDAQFIIKDLLLPKGVTVFNDPDQVVVKITELVSKEAQEQAAAEAAAAEAAKEETKTEGEPEEQIPVEPAAPPQEKEPEPAK